MNFQQEFYDLVNKSKVDWTVLGLLSNNDDIYALGSDTKVLSTVFELLCTPFINRIAEKHGYKVEHAVQTVYPDFTLLKGSDDPNKIAIDVKTTYRREGNRPFGYTLGSYTSFLRNNTKNILYPYDTYKEHWIIGFLYSRKNMPEDSKMVFSLKDRGEIVCPFADVEFFVQEKYKIAGERPGSGNTTNIGSILTNNIDDYRKGRGPFAKLGERAFEDYWKNFNKESNKRKYNNIEKYLRIKKRKLLRGN